MEDDIFGGVPDTLAEVTSSVTDSTSSLTDSLGDLVGDGLSALGDLGAGALTGAALGVVGAVLGGINTLNPNELISSYRRNGIPFGAERDYYSGNASTVFYSTPGEVDWRVNIFSPIILQSQALFPLAQTNGMVFPYLPSIQFQSTARYDQIPVTHTNYPFWAYKNSQVEDINITGTFTVQDQNEGIYWLAVMHFLRTVTKMYFGSGPNLGNPPPICTLNGYGDFVFNNISVVVKQFNISLQKDVDYISINGPMGISYVPVRSDISVVVSPVFSREKIKSFNLSSFANGNLISGYDGKGWI